MPQSDPVSLVLQDIWQPMPIHPIIPFPSTSIPSNTPFLQTPPVSFWFSSIYSHSFLCPEAFSLHYSLLKSHSSFKMGTKCTHLLHLPCVPTPSAFFPLSSFTIHLPLFCDSQPTPLSFIAPPHLPAVDISESDLLDS